MDFEKLPSQARGELKVLRGFKELEADELRLAEKKRDDARFKSANWDIINGFNDVVEVMNLRPAIESTEDNRTLHVVDSALQYYQSLISVLHSRLKELQEVRIGGDLKKYAKTMDRLYQSLDFLGILESASPYAYVIRGRYFGGIQDSKLLSVEFNRGFVVVTDVGRYVVETLLEAKKLEYTAQNLDETAESMEGKGEEQPQGFKGVKTAFSVKADDIPKPEVKKGERSKSVSFPGIKPMSLDK